MRSGWSRGTNLLEFSAAELTELLRPAVSNPVIESFVHTKGGLANTNITVQLKDHEKPLLMRFIVRDPQQAQKEFAILSLVSKKVPVGSPIYFSETNSLSGHPYLVREWISGERLENAIETMSPEETSSIAYEIGKTLAAVHSFKFPQAGFLDGKLNIETNIDVGSAGLIEFAKECLIDGIGGARLGTELTNSVMSFLRIKAPMLDEWQAEPCLTHSDFGGSNILVSNERGVWKVAAVLDWEFAFSGTPFFDFGNLLREPLQSVPDFLGSVYSGYIHAGGQLPDNWRQLSLLTDLTAWFDFLTRPTANDVLISDAARVIDGTMKELA